MLLLSLTLFATSAHAEGIYGTWKPLRSQCTPAGGAIEVGRFALAQDEEVCSLVAPLDVRGGTAKAECSGGDGEERVVRLAFREKGRRLHIERDGVPDATPYVRCRS